MNDTEHFKCAIIHNYTDKSQKGVNAVHRCSVENQKDIV